MESKIKVSVFWFRRDLRLEDNAGLYEALRSNDPVLPLFIFDADILDKLSDKKDKRVDLIRQMLVVLDAELKKSGSSLTVKHGKPLDIFRQLTEEFDISSVYTNRDYESYGRKRDAEIEQYLRQKNISFHSFKDQIIFEYYEILKANGRPYTVFTPYSRIWRKALQEEHLQPYKSRELTNHLFQYTADSIPALEEIGFYKTGIEYKAPTLNLTAMQNYHETRDFPSIENGTTHMSVHLRFGTISIRHLVGIAVKENDSWLNELIWREFFMSILVNFPHVENGAFRPEYDQIRWRNDLDEFQRWCEGKTGYPIVDAGMRELNETGYMHNRVRMIVASFLTKHLLINWRWGEAYFATKLLDYDLAANNGNWQWSAGCGCDAAPYFRVFNPTEQTKKFDPERKYIYKWVKNLHEPDYPQPIVEHSFARERALETYKEVL